MLLHFNPPYSGAIHQMKRILFMALLAQALNPAFAEPNTHPLTNTTGKAAISTKLDHACIRVADIERSIDFYNNAFGLKVIGRWDSQTIGEGEQVKTMPSLGAMLADDTGGAIEMFQDENTLDKQEFQRPINHFAFRTNDVEAAYQKALNAGATPIMPPTTISTAISKVKTSFVSGPDGERIEIISYVNE